MKKFAGNALVAIIASLFSACALLGPSYTKPKVDTPKTWQNDKSSESTSLNMLHTESQTLMNIAWWHKFNDPVLDAMMKRALSNNNNIQVALGNIAAASAQLEKVRMQWVPTVNLAGGGFVGQGFNQAINPANPGMSQFFNQSTSNFNGAYGDFVPTYSLNIFRLIKGQDVAKLNLKMQQALKNAVRLAVINQVSNSYFTLLGLHKELELQQTMIDDARQLKYYTAIQLKEGAATQMNIEGLNQFIADLSVSIPKIKQNIIETENALQVLMNQNPSHIKLANSFDNITTSGVVPINLPSEVLKNRPDIIAAEYRLQMNNAAIGVATSQFFPSIMLTSPVGISSFQLGNLFSGSADFWATQIAATMPILNLGIYADIHNAKAGYYSAYYNYIQTVRGSFADVENSLAKITASNNVYASHQQELQSAQNMYSLAKTQYKSGAVSFSSTIGYKLNVDTAMSNINQAKMNQLTSIVSLYQAVAAGYNVGNSDKLKKFHDNHDI